MGNDSLQGCEFWTVVIPKGRNEKNTIRIGVVGFGKVGRACAELLLTSKDLFLAAIVRRLDSLAQPLPEVFSKIPVVSHTAQVHEMDAALLCVPIDQVEGVAHDCLQHGLPIIECALLHGEAFQAHREAINRFATRFDVPAIVGAGWDPGALSVMRSFLTAHMMLAAARALPGLRPGTHSLLDLPVGALWGAQLQMAERIWL